MTEPVFNNRYEVKYLVETRRLAEVRRALEDFFMPDENSENGDGYHVYSVYFDSPRHRFYSEKREGQLIRLKPRVRHYRATPDSPPSEYFLELKGRYDRIVLKRRERITRELAERLLTNAPVNGAGADLDSSILKEFHYLIDRFHLSPCVTVQYHRQPFNSAFYPNVRVTFDQTLQCSFATSLDAPAHAFAEAIPPNWFVLELKYTEKLPQLLLNRFHRLGLQQRSVSKFAVSLEQCYEQIRRRPKLA